DRYAAGRGGPRCARPTLLFYGRTRRKKPRTRGGNLAVRGGVCTTALATRLPAGTTTPLRQDALATLRRSVSASGTLLRGVAKGWTRWRRDGPEIFRWVTFH